MSFWQILGRFAVSDTGETLQKLSDTTSVLSDGSVFTQMGSFSTDGSTRMGSIATGIGAVFNDRDDWSSAPGIEKDQS